MARSRRRFLAKLASGGLLVTGAAAGVVESGAFTTVKGDRGVDVSVAGDTGGLVGIDLQGPVKKNSRDPLAEFTNNTGGTITVTVTLDDCTEGTLYDNDGESGCSVSFTLMPDNAQFVDIQASVQGTIGFSVDVSGDGLAFSAGRSVESEAGNNPGAVRIQKPNKDQDFDARANRDEWTVKSVDVRDADGDDDLDRVELEVTEGDSGGTVVASRTIQTPPDRYQENNLTLTPDTAGYDVVAGQLYTLTVRGYDADGNSATATVQDTASNRQGGPGSGGPGSGGPGSGGPGSGGPGSGGPGSGGPG